MEKRDIRYVSRRRFLKTAGVYAVGVGAAGLGLSSDPKEIFCGIKETRNRPHAKKNSITDRYFPPSEKDGGWRTGDPEALGVDGDQLKDAIDFHDTHSITVGHGGAIVIIYKGYIIGESYVTGTEGGPQPWTPQTCNDMKSSTKSVFGTAVGVFLEEYKDRVNLDTLLVGTSRENSLIPQIWEQPITDERKTKIKVKNAISMTSGHESREPWLAPSTRHRYRGYKGSFQMYEYCFGWWHFKGIPDHHILKFEPGTDFNYSNYGLEQMALAMRNISGEKVGPYIYDRVLSKIGMPLGIRNNQYRDMPYTDDRELNFSDEPGWGVGGSKGCDAYGADKSESPFGYNSIVGSTFRCTARDFARLGYLWLNKGRWGNEQLVSREWMKLATSRYVRENGKAPVKYGYTFWIQDDLDDVPKDLFMSRGHNLNHSFVIPSLDLVVVRQGNETRQPKGQSPFSTTLIKKVVSALPTNNK
jgi:CubicO group peptidase (beta-lactamase class C family)